MSSIGFDDQVPSLPVGGGAVTSLGSTFTPDLSTGTGSFNVAFDAPNGPGDIGPRLGLRYDTAGGNGPFGLGFALPLPRIVLDTSIGYPRYAGDDPLLLEGAGRLFEMPDGSLRPEVDGGVWRAEKLGSGFRLTDRDGKYYDLGTQPAARIADPVDPRRVYAWQLETISDALGNSVQFTWLADGAQRYLQTVAYGQYALEASYAARPDVLRTGRPGFTLSTGLRCTQMELQLVGAAQPVLRRWSFGYARDPANGVSLLESVVLTGFAPDGGQLNAPPLQFGYSQFGDPNLLQLGSGDAALPTLARQGAGRVELVDWNGDGLPDVVEFGSDGNASVWTNGGNETFTGPSRVGVTPLAASAQATLAFADMDGDGFADLIRLDRPLAEYVPRIEPGGFGEPVTFTQAPASIPGATNVRLLDLTGDGSVDLMSSSQSGLALYYRDADGGWKVEPQIVTTGEGPVVFLDDPHVFVADMTGDGSSDVVRIDGGGVRYWPYLGNGRWDDPVTMTSPPNLPFDVNMERLQLTDIDGDGCADVVYLNADTVTYWINQSGTSFADPHVIDYVPTPAISQPRLADMTGSGTAGLVWSQLGPFGRSTRYFYLEFVGATKPRLLTSVDNGIGLLTTIAYTTSAREAARAAAAGEKWTTTLPLALSIVAGVRSTDTATARVRETRFAYRDGRYDGVLREFAGFGRVDQREIGDDDIPTLLTTSHFHTGVDPSAPQAQLSEATRRRLRAIRGRMYRRERYGVDGTPQEVLPYDRVDQSWDVVTEAGQIQVPRMISNVQSQFERLPAPAATVTTTNAAWDGHGNITDSTQTIEVPGEPGLTQVLRTRCTFANDPAGRFLSLIYRTQQSDGTGTIVADQITEYDTASEGTVGTRGLVTRRSALVLTEGTVATAYGGAPPDFAALGYFTRTDSPGWWIVQGAYERVDDAAGFRGVVTGPNGASITVSYDESRSYPATMVDPAGNRISAAYDYRVSRASTLTDAADQEFQATFDALARLVKRIEPGDTVTLPTLSYEYDAASLPVSLTQHVRAVSGAAVTVDQRSLYDGDDTLIQIRAVDAVGEIAVETHIYNSRGLLAAEYAAWRPPSQAYAVPPASVAHATLTYDALGRLLTRTNPDGAVRRWTYGPLAFTETDERGKVTTKSSDGTGRITSIAQQLGPRTLISTNTFDVKGNLVGHTDAAGNVVHTFYDLLGRVIRVQRPESDVATVYDAAGNPVEARASGETLVNRKFDACNRLLAVATPASANPVASFVYQDAGAPAPPDAGQHTTGGRCVRVDDEGGSTVFDYDALGRPALKRSTPDGSAQSYELKLAYRPDGQIDSVTYPKGNGPQVILNYQYDERGLLTSVPGVATDIGHDLDGRRTSITYANGVRSTYGYDLVGRYGAIEHATGAGAFYSAALTWDGTGNLVALASPDPELATTFEYDDLNRLTNATTHAGSVLTYAYDDIGNLTRKSDVGTYGYGGNGAPATCLTAAGADAFTYTALGQMQQTPWGMQSFDPLGRLVSIDGPTTASFTYDYAGLRVSARFTKGGVSSIRLTPDPLYAIENGTLVLYLFDGVRAVAREVDGGPRTYLLEDHLGSIVRVTDATAAVVDSIRYDPFGAVVSRTPAGATTPVGFAHGELDAAIGLLYLEARYYHPVYGRFISPDPVVQDVFDPSAWNAYAYCRNNPQSYIDPSGRISWQILVGALAVVAIIVLVAVSVVTFGATTPLLVVAIGLVAGGVVGGIAAAKAGGDASDILLGVLVGAAVGGWASFAAIYAGGAVAGALGIKGMAGAITAGAINGAINGAAIGFAAGFAGGHTTLDQILEKVALGALVGAVVGGALGGLSYHWSTTPSPSQPMGQQVPKALQATPPLPGTGGLPPTVAPPVPGPPPISSFTGALGQVGQGVALKGASPVGEAILRYLLTGPFASATTTLLVDGTAGFADLVTRPILNRIGVVKAPEQNW
jgi:RHS repeat-associated protein